MRDRLRGAWFRAVGVAGVNPISRRLHPLLYRWTGGAWLLGRSLGNLTILLTTTGRHTGQLRVAALWAYPDGNRLVVVGSNGGSHHAPAWVLNLRSRPEGTVELRRERRAMRAQEAAGEEYERLWQLVNAAYPGYEAYREWAHRTIPLVVLSPDSAAAGPQPRGGRNGQHRAGCWRRRTRDGDLAQQGASGDAKLSVAPAPRL